VTPTVDAFHALARSSPWRWTTLHLRHRAGNAGAEIEAWLCRPDGVRLTGNGQPVRNSIEGQRADGRSTGPWSPPAPTYRPDGLVGTRPRVDTDGLFWNSYYWLAMLDPVELSHHVDVDNLREDEVAGRLVWRADLRAQPGYDPRCGGNCCELLYSEAGLRADFPDPDEVPEERRGRHYPDHHDVALDVETGIVVRCLPVDGPEGSAWLENDILEAG
jgi:hypothetical protein